MSDIFQVIDKLNKEYKTEFIKVGMELNEYDKIPFSSPRANYMTYGGIPLGKATEFFGPENGGKTTSALDIVGNAQKRAKRIYDEKVGKLKEEIEKFEQSDSKRAEKNLKKLQEQLSEVEAKGPRKVVYVDSENTLDEDWAELQGVDTGSLILIRPQDHTAEQVFQIMLDIIDTGEVECMVLDSIPMLVSQNLYEESMEKKSYGGIAGAAAEFARKVSGKIAKHNTALILINQVREDLANPYNVYKTPGGRALRHLYGLRLYVDRGSFIDENNKELRSNAENPFGNLVNMKIIKTKVCKPDRRVGYYTLHYNNGVDVLGDTVDVAMLQGFITQAGAWYYIMDPETGEIMRNSDDEELKFNGKATLLEFLRDDEDFFNELYEAVNKKLEEED